MPGPFDLMRAECKPRKEQGPGMLICSCKVMPARLRDAGAMEGLPYRSWQCLAGKIEQVEEYFCREQPAKKEQLGFSFSRPFTVPTSSQRINDQPSPPPIAVQAFTPVHEALNLRRLAALFWPHVPVEMQVDRLDEALEQGLEMETLQGDTVYHKLSALAKPFYAGQVAWTAGAGFYVGDVKIKMENIYPVISSLLGLRKIPRSRCGSSMRLSVEAGHKVVDEAGRAVVGWPSDARVQFADHRGRFNSGSTYPIFLHS